MTAKLDYRWHLREMMAQAGMHSTSAMGPLLADRGIRLSSSQVYRLVTEKPERLNLKVLMALGLAFDLVGCDRACRGVHRVIPVAMELVPV
jgi:hypothetical protein